MTLVIGIWFAFYHLENNRDMPHKKNDVSLFCAPLFFWWVLFACKKTSSGCSKDSARKGGFAKLDNFQEMFFFFFFEKKKRNPKWSDKNPHSSEQTDYYMKRKFKWRIKPKSYNFFAKKFVVVSWICWSEKREKINKGIEREKERKENQPG